MAEARDALEGWVDDSCPVWGIPTRSGCGRAEELFPHLILVDDEVGGESPTPLERELGGRVAGAKMVLLIEPDAVRRASRAVLAGAWDFVTKPLREEQLVSTLRELLSRAPAIQGRDPDAARGRVILSFSAKMSTRNPL